MFVDVFSPFMFIFGVTERFMDNFCLIRVRHEPLFSENPNYWRRRHEIWNVWPEDGRFF